MLLLPPHGAIAAGNGTLVLKTDSGPHNFNIEIATTNGERALGLMYRRELPADAGMLFLYDPPQPITMWMRNTIMPLDMIFIGTDGKVHRIESHTEPFSTDIISSDGDGAGRARAQCRHRRQDRAEDRRRGRLSRAAQRAETLSLPRSSPLACRIRANYVCAESRAADRGIAQSGSAPALGAGGRKFKSCCPDHLPLS